MFPRMSFGNHHTHSISKVEILLELVQGAGSNWANQRHGWVEGAVSVCAWEGIRCNEHDEVVEINLSNAELIGTIPDSLSVLTSLKHLLLAENKLYGEIPPSLGTHLRRLTEIDLSENRLNGSIPMMHSTYLEIIDFSGNQLSGTIPMRVGEGLERMRVFKVKGNRMEGMLPESLGYMKGLVDLDLSNNIFIGPIPYNFGNLLNLKGLFLNHNKLSGNIPISLTQDILLLEHIHLQSNRLSGTLPAALADLPHLKTLFINGNKITGRVPEELCSKNLNEILFSIDVTKNAIDNEDNYSNILNRSSTQHQDFHDESSKTEITTPDYEMSEMSSGENDYRTLDGGNRSSQDPSSERNGCNSIACPAGYYSTNAVAGGIFPCVKCDQGYRNPFIGASKCHVFEQNDILKQFYTATGGEGWKDDFQTWKNDSVPICEKNGITCASDGNVIEIRVPDMKLSGAIPEDLAFLMHLKVLDLSDNSLYGRLPSELHFLPLEILDVSGNMLTGFVPPALCTKLGINGNGKNGITNCDFIACRVGSFSKTGRAEVGGRKCRYCSYSDFLGSKSCVSPSPSHTDVLTTIIVLVGCFGVVVFGATIFLIFKWISRRNEDTIGFDDNSFLEEFSDESDDLYPDKDRRRPILAWSIAHGGQRLSSTQAESVHEGETASHHSMEQREVWLDVPKIG